jgi:F-type H+-transporting ATPase subunit delta
MNTEKISSVYARALVDVGRARDEIPRLVEDFHLLQEVVAADPRFSAFLTTPNVGVEEKMAVFERGLGRKVSKTFRAFLGIVLARRRGALIWEIADLFRRETDALSKTARAWVKTAVPLSAASSRRLRTVLQNRLGRKVVLEERVDSRIIGGIKIRVGDSVVDGTLLTRLGDIRKRMELGKIRGEVGYED